MSAATTNERSDYRLGQSVLVRGTRIELVGLRESGRGVLHVYGGKGDESSFSQFFGELEDLRAFVRSRYPDAQFHETMLDGFFEQRDVASICQNDPLPDQPPPPENFNRAHFIKATV